MIWEWLQQAVLLTLTLLNIHIYAHIYGNLVGTLRLVYVYGKMVYFSPLKGQRQRSLYQASEYFVLTQSNTKENKTRSAQRYLWLSARQINVYYNERLSRELLVSLKSLVKLYAPGFDSICNPDDEHRSCPLHKFCPKSLPLLVGVYCGVYCGVYRINTKHKLLPLLLLPLPGSVL